MQSLLVGESAAPDAVAAVRRAVESQPGVAALLDLRTLQLGPDEALVAVRIRPRDAADAVATVRRVATAVQEALPGATSYVEPAE